MPGLFYVPGNRWESVGIGGINSIGYLSKLADLCIVERFKDYQREPFGQASNESNIGRL